MTTLTIKVSDKKQAKMLYEILLSMKFVKAVDMEDDLSEVEISILGERLEEYKNNPKSGKPLDVVIENLGKKYGYKNSR